LLPESAGFYNWMNAEEYLFYFAALYNIELQIAKKRIRDLLEKVGLATKSSVPIGFYSRGMKQRLGLARTLINEPKIIFLDEPTLGLDPKGQQDIQKILMDLNRENNVTIFFSSHALNEVSSLCNRIAIVNKGILVAEGSVEELRKLVGTPSGYLSIRILDLPDTQKALSNLPLRFEPNTQINEKGFLDISVIEEKSQSVNKVIEIFEKSGLQIYEIKRLNPSLDEIFFKLTDSKKQYIYKKDNSEKWNNIGKNHVNDIDTTDLKIKNNRSEK
jgi:ABC-type multidrug transport system ATPase subunit